MSDPKRLLDGGGTDLEIELLQSVSDDGLSEEAKRRVMARVALGVAAAGTAVAAKSSVGAWFGKAWLLSTAKWGAIVLVPAVVVAGVVTMRRVEPSPGAAPAKVSLAGVPTSSVVPALPFDPSEQDQEEEVPVAAPSTDEPFPSATSAISSTRASVASSASSSHRRVGPSASGKAGTLAREVASLRRIRAALSGGQPGRALQLLDAYEREFPHRLLVQEATILRIEALIRSGNRPEALRLARRLLQKGGNAYRKRLHSLLPELDK